MPRIEQRITWEASDIDYENPIHQFLRSVVAFVALDLMLIHRERIIKGTEDEKNEVFKEIVADLLNLVNSDERVSLVLKEPSADQRGVTKKVDCNCPGKEYGAGFHNSDCPNREARPFA